ncbi:MAG: hypothetical protein RIC14_11805 [Filomicrobium sp.]
MAIIIGLAFAVLVVVLLAAFVVPEIRRVRRLEDVVVEEIPDQACAFGYKMAWLAIRTEDTQKLVRSLKLARTMPANWNSGIGTVYDDKLGPSHVYVTPPVDGWTFVVGLALPHPVNERFVDKLTPLLLSLGDEFNEVQYFFTYPLIDFFAWARVQNRRLTRAFAVNDEGIVWNKGRITRAEKALGMSLFELRGVRERHGDAGGELVLYPTEEHVMQIARSWSIDPIKLDQMEAGAGVGFLAPIPASWSPERRRKAAA